MYPTLDGPAAKLDDLHLTLKPEPLIEPGEFKKYYRGQVNKVRGEDTVARLSRKLQQSYKTVPFKAFLMGHSGVGKSTEISRLLEHVKDQHAGIRLNIATELNPASFKVFDVLLLMLIRVAEEADKLKAIPLLSQNFYSDIQRWFATEQDKSTINKSVGGEVSAGAGVKEGSLWASLLGLSASAKAEIKYASDRKTEVVEYRLRRLPELVSLCNRLIDSCNQALLDKTGKEWILVIEDLDKTSISPRELQELFVQYGNVFRDLRVNLIFTIPVWLAYSPEGNRLPFERHMIHDTPVYDQWHVPHEAGRAAVRDVLTARVSPALFADDDMTRFIVASGGNLRDLFSMVLDAGEGASVTEPSAAIVGPEDARRAINKMRVDYRRRLGESPYDAQPIPYSDKVARLLAVYRRDADHDVPDAVLYSLLRARAVQEFNGDGWFGVHPLVVDILKDQKHLQREQAGGTD